jgi:hypothetical protein
MRSEGGHSSLAVNGRAICAAIIDKKNLEDN